MPNGPTRPHDLPLLTPFSGLPLAGLLLAASCTVTMLAGLSGLPLMPLAGAMAWLAFLVLMPRMTARQRKLSGVLLTAGVACIVFAVTEGLTVNWLAVLTQNVALLAMLAGVSTLKLVAIPPSADSEVLPRGRMAFARTMIGTHLFGAVINMSMVIIIGDRLSEAGRGLPRGTARLLSRAFPAAAFWSPFFAAMGVALTYSPGASVINLFFWGVPLALVALLFTQFQLAGRSGDRLDDFRGYPMRFGALWIPVSLALAVLFGHHFWPGVKVIVLVPVFSIALTAGLLLLRNRRQAGSVGKMFLRDDLPKMAGEVSLFMAAGVLGVGLAALSPMLQSFLPFEAFTWWLASLLLPALVMAALIGVHPIVSVATVSVWLAPLSPEPDLMASLFLSVWALGTASSPLSGINLALQGRYGVAAKTILCGNLPYALFMCLACPLVFFCIDRL